jgi:hypothetical protein
MKMRTESGQSLVAYVLILVLLTIIVICVLGLIADYQIREDFKKAIDNGNIVLFGNRILPGQVGNPLHTEIDSADVPSKASEISSYPGKFLVTGCGNFLLGTQATSVYAATPVPTEVASMVVILVPLQPGGYVQVCVPDELTDVPIFLWSK